LYLSVPIQVPVRQSPITTSPENAIYLGVVVHQYVHPP
jgi:hypothetical protein